MLKNTRKIAVSVLILYASPAVSQDPIVVECSPAKGEETHIPSLDSSKPFQTIEYTCPASSNCRTKQYVVDQNDGWSINVLHYKKMLVDSTNSSSAGESRVKTYITVTRATGEYEMTWDIAVGERLRTGKEWGACKKVPAPTPKL